MGMGLSLGEIFVIVSPFLIAYTLIFHWIDVKHEKLDEIKRIKEMAMTSAADEKTVEIKQKLHMMKRNISWAEEQVEKLNNVGMHTSVKELGTRYSIFMGLGLFFAIFILRGGILLSLYCIIAGAVIQTYLIIEKRNKLKKLLRQEFFFVLRNITAQLSSGKLFLNSIEEIVATTHLSPIMYNEMCNVRNSLNVGNKTSDTFYLMYESLNIPEIKNFADALMTFENIGGNINAIITAQTDFFFELQEIDDQMSIYEAKVDNQIKITGGIPILIIIGIQLFMSDFFGDFFKTILGQLSSIACFSVMMVGVYLSKKKLKLD